MANINGNIILVIFLVPVWFMLCCPIHKCQQSTTLVVITSEILTFTEKFVNMDEFLADRLWLLFLLIHCAMSASPTTTPAERYQIMHINLAIIFCVITCIYFYCYFLLIPAASNNNVASMGQATKLLLLLKYQ